jgi:hypothetical protein
LSSEVEKFYTCISESNNVKFQRSFQSTSPGINSLLGIYGLGVSGGSDELDKFNDEKQNKLMKSVLSKSRQSSEKQISLNKFLEIIFNRVEPLLTNGKLRRILVELEKPCKVNFIETTHRLINSACPKDFEKITNDFESLLENQKVLNKNDSELL